MEIIEYSLKNSLGHMMGRISRSILSQLQKSFIAAGCDLSVEQWLLLVHLRDWDGQIHQQLAQGTYRDKTTISRLLDGLEKRGLVERVPDAADRRQKRVRIMPEGRQLIKKLKPLALKIQNKAMEDIAIEDIDACRKILSRIYHNITSSQQKQDSAA
jgi:MarR family transcriptional regulator, organic hydroperoxide resistance regulator